VRLSLRREPGLADLERALAAVEERLADAEQAVAAIEVLRVERRSLLVDERLGGDVADRLAEIEREIEQRPARRDDLAAIVDGLRQRAADAAEREARPAVEQAEARLARVSAEREQAEARAAALAVEEREALAAVNAARGDLARARAAFDLDARREIERVERRRRKRVERLARHGSRQLDSPLGGERLPTALERAAAEDPLIVEEVAAFQTEEAARLGELRRIERERNRREARESWERAGVAPPR
jgi:hypothetical protein